MRYIKTTHWTDIKNQQGLLFFAQTINEAIFDYTLDTYKPQALNIRLLCIEALQTIDNIKIGLIKKPNINSIIDELLWSLKGDFIAREIIGSKLDGIVEKINNNKSDLKGLRQIILLLYHYFDNKKYLKKIQEVLIEIVPAQKEKEKIYKAARLLLTELINYGYSTGYIYHIINRHFYNRSQKFNQKSPKPFFEKFNYEKKKFTVVYKVSKLFNEFSGVDALVKFKISEKYSLKGLKGAERKFIEEKGIEEIFIIFEEVEALDDNVARVITEIPLDRIGNLFSFYHHKEIPEISAFALVINHTDKVSSIREKSTKSIIKKSDIKPNIAALKVKKLFGALELSSNTIYRIGRAIDLHSISLTTQEIENKLLNIWTALETLIPKDIECGNDRIVQIADALMPFQIIGYVKKLIEQAGSDFWFFDQNKSKEILNTVVVKNKENSFNSLAAFIMTSENNKKREEVYGLLDNYPILKYRLFTLNKSLSKGKEVKKLIENHRQKVEWQIRRIYRVRNLITHSGEMPSYTNILVENLHNYFDDFLNYIIDNAITEKRIKTVNEAVLNCEIDCDTIMRNLDKIGDSPITLDNFKLVFGD